jgi:hypothetical protein
MPLSGLEPDVAPQYITSAGLSDRKEDRAEECMPHLRQLLHVVEPILMLIPVVGLVENHRCSP